MQVIMIMSETGLVITIIYNKYLKWIHIK